MLSCLSRLKMMLEEASLLKLDGQDEAVTFAPMVFDAHPNTLKLLTFGGPLLARLLEQVPALEWEEPQGAVLRLAVEEPLPGVAYYALDQGGQPRRLGCLTEVRKALEAPGTRENEGRRLDRSLRS